MKRSEYYNSVKFFVACFLAAFSIVLMIVLLALCVNRDVTQTQYAIGYDTYNMEFTKIYEQGKHVTRVGEHWTIVQRTLQEMQKNNEECLTKDKVLVDLTLTLQFEYQKDSLIPVLKRLFKDDNNYKQAINNAVLSSVRETCVKFNAEDFYDQRSIIDQQMFSDVRQNVNNATINGKKFGTNVEFFQLVNIGFPPTFSALIETKQQTEQQAQTAINDRESILTQAETGLLEAEREADIIIINANNTATININAARTNATVETEKWGYRAFTYGHVQRTLGFNGTDTIGYIETENIQKARSIVTSA